MSDEGPDDGKKGRYSERLRGFLARVWEELQEDESEHGFPVTLIMEHRDDILRYSAMVLGVMLLLTGIVTIMGSSDRVVDNVVSGENTVIAAFLILTGLLLVGAFMVHSIIGGTPLEGFYKQVKKAERGEEKEEEE
ncbi:MULTISPECIES: hypothetical protein [Methanothermobacter]|jgi:branched-subunit amino acid transport protein AzlD|uniref:Uncharacterized protein n=1 Tax=Methanothermobacter thermautotrophicus (strain ATCC 29096 / DSM 1053 / JCM 10044 / NBRC 100330 / Delta H) TaxID=187420 RepID=O27368_METTH|nr:MULTISPECIES: hypothetical protein [Methanothermobacter]AAB85791.1 unknown [Methanothermobacter thermautotrophicus str. Delta H]BAZ99317.1 hypothetical protein tca_01267 [Methanothermobacter sp. EMTCatA1]HOQ18804.1 hypothetical protein [Methanothermobacter thermautotrophicus]